MVISVTSGFMRYAFIRQHETWGHRYYQVIYIYNQSKTQQK